MTERVTRKIRLELKSDAIFGSGFSAPGGEDIGVCTDARGYPYLKGSTFKGLLRESVQNVLAWTNRSESELEAIFGKGGWSPEESERQIRLTELTLENRPESPEDCFALRTFTKIENGVVAEGSLRSASVVLRGGVFCGEIEFAAGDEELISAALSGIKYLGTHRSRGFGYVKVTSERAQSSVYSIKVSGESLCLRFRLKTLSPVLITDLYSSRGNDLETRGYIPGSAIRGLIVGRLAASDPAWFEKNRRALLSDNVKFLDAVPVRGKDPVIPSIKGYYEDKKDDSDPGKVFKNVLVDPDPDAVIGLKRARLGSFMSISNDTASYWSADTGSELRINLSAKSDDTKMFQTGHIASGQELEGYVLASDPETAKKIAGAFTDIVWLGADRHSGFGKCKVAALDFAKGPAWEHYGISSEGSIDSDRLYMLAVSPFSMLNDEGELCGLDVKGLGELLGVEIESVAAGTSVSEYGAFNRTWGSREPAAAMYDRGSLFRLKCSTAPKLERLKAIEREGLGIRRAEGFGQVLFIDPKLLDEIDRKKAALLWERDKIKTVSEIRQERINWILKNVETVRGFKVSNSQIGDIQAICERAAKNGGDLTELYDYLSKNVEGRGAAQGDKFKGISAFIHDVLDNSLPANLGISNNVQRLKLLISLFDHSRKKEERSR